MPWSYPYTYEGNPLESTGVQWSMLATLLAVAIQTPKYEATLVCTVTPKYMRSFAHCSVLTDQETVAGFTCVSTGHHGETTFGVPFVWSKGRFHKLPLPEEAEYGHVYGGNDSMLVGSVSIDYRRRPATWTPDGRLGWAKAQVKVLSMKEGYATHIGPDGAIWVQDDNKVVRRLHGNKWEELSMGQFSLAGIDSRGRLFGNQFKGITFGKRPTETSPAMYDDGNWTMLKVTKPSPDLGGGGYFQAINSKGVGTGSCQNQAAIWNEGEVSLLLNGKKRWSYARGINDSGVVVGSCAVSDIYKSMPFVWDSGKLTDLSKSVPGVELEEAVKINNRGVIAVTGHVERTARLYLLRPSN